MKHTCGERCLIRIGPGDGPENFNCRKQHAVKDTPDPTCHQFIELPCNLSDVPKDIMICAGIFVPLSHDACASLFSRTEYQQEYGNVPHEHNILALKKDSLNSLSIDQLNNLIATNVMEILKFDQIEKLISDGLLSCPWHCSRWLEEVETYLR